MMKRAFTKRETVLLVILAVIIVACVYFLFVIRPTGDKIASNEAALSAIQSEVGVQQTVAQKAKALQEEIDAYNETGSAQNVQIPSFDNTRNTVAELDSIMGASSNYTLDFGEVTTDGTLVRRQVSVAFTANSYGDALSIMRRLAACKYRCAVTDFSLTQRMAAGVADGTVSGTATVTFFETTASPASDAGAETTGTASTADTGAAAGTEAAAGTGTAAASS